MRAEGRGQAGWKGGMAEAMRRLGMLEEGSSRLKARRWKSQV